MTAHKLWWRQGHALTLALLQVAADVEAEVSVRSLVLVSLHTPSRFSVSSLHLQGSIRTQGSFRLPAR